MQPRINRDSVSAVFLLLFCGVFIAASFDIEETNYGTLQSSVWPQIILGALSVFSLLLLTQALRRPPAAGAGGGLLDWLQRYRNPLICYALFLGFLVSLPVLGMLLGGILFVLLMLTILGGGKLAQLPLHLGIAVISVGAMWAIFTYALGVFLPGGIILNLQ
ncbi:MAG: tripartite tricarboxylate transporter TctB family protein [Kiloniellales bacterium]|nr:tripartite tricarboxylate transporter TctB family protein [Kiloniellales bacterium]MDJ0969422.1 tripartite tricarboxylate transporter TctB family protein [Kiloniellales bacterium]MDJ0980805.1 tripartite tricarboxylate transporter TctB family protein [Kiloniellales bacterium]